MTLTRLSLLALAFCGLNLIACGEKDTGDTMEEGDADTDSDADGDADADTDADADSYFVPYLKNWGFDGGIIGGEPVTVTGSHGDQPPLFYVELFEKEYLEEGDERYTCIMAWEPTMGLGTAATDAWMDWTFDLGEAYYSDCDNLDPNVYGDDPTELFGQGQWELSGEAVGDALADIFIGWVGEEKYGDEWEPYVFGGQAWNDGQQYEGDGDPQVMWGVVWSLDGTTLSDDSELLETTDIAMGSDGFYRFISVYLWYLQ
ncbi:MAG: hypothetical protein ABIO70_19940 [Pseudomonadota bacterium]